MFKCALVCVCTSPCSCGVLIAVKKEREDDYIIKFLRGLNEEYLVVRSQVKMMTPMPSLSRTFSLVLQQEREFGSPLLPYPLKESTFLVNFADENVKPPNFSHGGSNSD